MPGLGSALLDHGTPRSAHSIDKELLANLRSRAAPSPIDSTRSSSKSPLLEKSNSHGKYPASEKSFSRSPDLSSSLDKKLAELYDRGLSRSPLSQTDKGPNLRSNVERRSPPGLPDRGSNFRNSGDRTALGLVDKGSTSRNSVDRSALSPTDKGTYLRQSPSDHNLSGHSSRGPDLRHTSDHSPSNLKDRASSSRYDADKSPSSISGRDSSQKRHTEKSRSQEFSEKEASLRHSSDHSHSRQDGAQSPSLKHNAKERKPSSYGMGLGLVDRQPSGRGSRGSSEEASRPTSSQRRDSSRLGSGRTGLLAALTDEMEQEERFLKEGQLKGNKKKKRKNPVSANLQGTRYDIVRQVADYLGFTIVKDDDPNAYLIWNDSFVSTDRVSELKPYQRINHFPGMGEICRKDCLARNMIKMAKAHPEEYNFLPKTWIFPSEYGIFQNYARELKKKKKSKAFIVKPANGAMGNGIAVYKNAEKIPQNDHYIVQEYLDKPFLVDGYKCDMRIYVLVTSCDPLRIFLYNDGLLRMSTEKYVPSTDSNVDQLYMHLTNYSVNKHSENYEKSSKNDTGSKRSLKFFNSYLSRHDYDVAYLWRNITDLIIKTLVVGHSHILHGYRMCRPGQPPGSDSVCFEILGFDVLVDRKLRPWLLEINRSPSFGTDEKIDLEIKSGVLEDTLRLLNIKASDKRKNMAAQKAQAQKRLLRPTKRVDGDTELTKKQQSVEKKKEELKEILMRMRKDAVREEFENKHSGRFKRIFPPEDKFRREKYAELLSSSYQTFLSGRSNSLQQEIQKTYNNTLREEDILDMLAQCEADEKDGKAITTNRPPRGPKPLTGMPTLAHDSGAMDDDDEEDEDDYDKKGIKTSLSLSKAAGRPTSQRINKSKYLSKPGGDRSKSNENTESVHDFAEEMTKNSLLALNDMHIKFPGKTDDEADLLLDKLHENWKFHKPRIASYWLVKLDSIKRRKVIDIVRSNVRAVLQRTSKTIDVENLRLYRIINKVFNRLLWSHGQGLWSCFQEQGSNSWETIFSKSTEMASALEMGCCRRVVQLCRDCLLIVYQFASTAKGNSTDKPGQEYHTDDSLRDPSCRTMEIQNASWHPSNTVSQRVSRLYHSRSQSLNSLNGPS